MGTTLTNQERTEREMRVRDYIDKGFNLSDMAKALNVTREAVRQFCRTRGWLDDIKALKVSRRINEAEQRKLDRASAAADRAAAKAHRAAKAAKAKSVALAKKPRPKAKSAKSGLDNDSALF